MKRVRLVVPVCALAVAALVALSADRSGGNADDASLPVPFGFSFIVV